MSEDVRYLAYIKGLAAPLQGTYRQVIDRAYAYGYWPFTTSEGASWLMKPQGNVVHCAKIFTLWEWRRLSKAGRTTVAGAGGWNHD